MNRIETKKLHDKIRAEFDNNKPATKQYEALSKKYSFSIQHIIKIIKQ